MKPEEIDEEYLWDPGAEPDPGTARIERLLERYRHVPEPLAAPSAPRLHRSVWLPWSLAAGTILALSIGWLATRSPLAESGGSADRVWAVHGIEGLERAGAGDLLVATRDARVEIGDLGDVRIGAGSRVRIEDTGDEAHRLFLEVGTVRASIFAEPRVFQIGTPAGLTVDLGCEYDLAVDDEGVARLAVLSGQVAFETAGRKVIVPAGASCASVPDRGPDAPVFDDAPAGFLEAVRAIEFQGDPDPAAVERVLDAPRREDTLSLWHLLDAPSNEVAGGAYEVLARIVPQPAGVTREGILSGDPEQREAWLALVERDWR